jgi:hypothetical protein
MFIEAGADMVITRAERDSDTIRTRRGVTVLGTQTALTRSGKPTRVSVDESRPPLENDAAIWISPAGTSDAKHLWHEFSRPFGTRLSARLNPALKRWAILRISLRDKACGAVLDFPELFWAKPNNPDTPS